MCLKKIIPYLFFISLALAFSNSSAQNISNEGTDFWTVFPTHDASGGSLATMNVNITSKSNTRVTVSCGSYSETRDISANSIEIFEVDRSQSYIDYSDGNQPLTNRAIHILVAPGMPKVVAYSHVFAANRSAATLILPKESLGQKYFSMNYTQSGGGTTGQNYLTLIAVEDNTDLILYRKNGNTLPINLAKAGDVYEYISTNKEDFTGVFVEVDQTKSLCKRFAAFSGSTTITIGPCGGSSDPLLQQLYSVNSWGKNYGIVPFKNRRYIFRVMAQEDNTTVKVNGATIATLNRGQFYESQISVDASIVNADKLISVAQYSLTEACSSITGTQLQGDPEMVLLNPIEFNIKNITVFASNRNLILEKYVNVFMKSDKTGTFRLNGIMPGVFWTPMPQDPSYSFAQILVTEETLTLTADDGFNAIAYGYGRTESYAYSAGTNLYSTSSISLVNLSSGLRSLSSACLGQATNPTLTVPYRLTRITWNFNDGTSFVDNALANPVESVDNVGAKLYTYTSPVNKVFAATGTQIVTAIAVL
ncbi:MAG: IgGFc-binding protein, partial [Bacteroidia bacterium]